MTMKNLTFPALALIALAWGGAPALAADTAASDTGANAETTSAESGAATSEEVGVVEMTLGAEDAPITVIEYASFTCPHCATFHMNQTKKLKAEYIDTGKVRFIYRDVYFDRIGLWASMVARCDSDRFFGVTDLLYSKQDEWMSARDPVVLAGNLRKMGKVAGLSDERIDACMQDADKAKALVTWFEENAKADQIEATPTVVIDGEKLDGNSWSVIKEALDAKLEG